MKKLERIFIGILISMLVLVGCGNNDVGNNLDDNELEESVVIRFSTWDSGETLRVMEDIAADFMELHENVEIRIESVPDSYTTRLLTQIAGGDAPDIFQVGCVDVAMFQNRGALLDLTEFIEGENGINLDDFYESIIELGKIDGSVYLLPKDFTTVAVYYNRDLFDAAGIPYPTDDWTWDEFREIANQLTIIEDDSIVQWGVDWNGWLRSNLPVVYSFGGDVISEDGSTVLGYMNSEETISALEFINELVNVDGVSPTIIDQEAFQGIDLFLSEKVAMSITGTWPLHGYVEADLNFGTVMIPGGPAGQYGSIAFAGFGISPGSENQDVAWDFLRFMATEGQEIMIENALTAYIPAAISSGQWEDAHLRGFINAVDVVRLFPERFNPDFNATAGRRFEDVLEDIWLTTDGTADIRGLLEEAATMGQAELEEAMSNR